MDTNHITFFLTSLLVCGSAAFANSQTIDRTTGQEPATASAETNPASERIVAMIGPDKDEQKARGMITFVRNGDGVGVSGRVAGLKPMTSYRVTLNPPLEKPAPTPSAGSSSEGPSAGQPKAGPPVSRPPTAGAPDAGAPVAGQPSAGPPDGEQKPGAPGAGMEGSSISGNRGPSPAEKDPAAAAAYARPEGVLGTLTTDSTGAGNFTTTLRGTVSGSAPSALVGRDIIIEAPPATEEGKTEPTAIASGRVIAVNSKGETVGEAPGQPDVQEPTEEP